MDKSFRFTIIKRKIAPHLPILAKSLVALLAITILLGVTKAITQLTPSILRWWNLKQAAISFLKDPASVLTTTNGRTNFLVLGKGGAGHEAPDLTDTIIFASYHHKSGKTALVSLPRDLWIDSLKAKINTAYYYGNQKKQGGGLILAKAAAEEVIDQPIHYVAIVDFSGFKDVINLVGGIDINISEPFDDYKYPIPGQEAANPESARYEHLSFQSGNQLMDGERALKYVRSRNASGSQGTDFARSLRQQQVVLSLQQKLLSTETLLNPQKLSGLLALISKSVETNIAPDFIPALIKLAIQFNRQKLSVIALDQGDKQSDREGLLTNPLPQKYQGQWVLTGKNGTWDEVQQHIRNIFNQL